MNLGPRLFYCRDFGFGRGGGWVEERQCGGGAASRSPFNDGQVATTSVVAGVAERLQGRGLGWGVFLNTILKNVEKEWVYMLLEAWYRVS